METQPKAKLSRLNRRDLLLTSGASLLFLGIGENLPAIGAPNIDLSGIVAKYADRIAPIGNDYGLSAPDKLGAFAISLFESRARLSLETNWLETGSTPGYIKDFFSKAQDTYTKEVSAFNDNLLSDSRWLELITSTILVNNAVFFGSTDEKTGRVTITNAVLNGILEILCPWYPWC